MINSSYSSSTHQQDDRSERGAAPTQGPGDRGMGQGPDLIRRPDRADLH